MGAKVAPPERSQRISNVVAVVVGDERAATSRDSRVLPMPGEPSTVTSTAAVSVRARSKADAQTGRLADPADERRHRFAASVSPLAITS